MATVDKPLRLVLQLKNKAKQMNHKNLQGLFLSFERALDLDIIINFKTSQTLKINLKYDVIMSKDFQK